MKVCTTCGISFVAWKTTQGRWRSTCSPPCRLEALDRLLSVLAAQRVRLAAAIEEGEG
jgi:hypothetical protein